MQHFFPLPFFTFLKIIRENGGISARKVKNLFPWLLKTTAFEPLRWIELATKHRKVLQHQLPQDPIFVLGYYRSGTTYLQQFLLQDDRKGYHSVFQMIFPELMLSHERWLQPVMETISRIFSMQDPVHRIPLTWDFMGEEDATMTTAVNPMGAQWGFFFPTTMTRNFDRYVLFDSLSETEKQSWKDAFRYLVSKISMANGGRQLILKSPPQTARVQLLLEMYPNAKFVFIHRNPYEVFASNRRFWDVAQDIYTIGKYRSANIDENILSTYAKTMDQYLAQRSMVSDNQLVEVAYDDFIQHPVLQTQRIYEQLELEGFDHCQPSMSKFARAQKSFVRLSHQLNEADTSLVNTRWGKYLEAWNYQDVVLQDEQL